MRFYAVYRKGAIMTDDYSPYEILRGDHIKHIKLDLKYMGIKCPVRVYDEHDKLVCRLNVKKSA